LKRIVEERFGVVYHERSIGKLLKLLGFSHISARPRTQARRRKQSRRSKNFRQTLKAHLAHVRSASQSRFGSKMKPGSATRTDRFANGRGVERDRVNPPVSAIRTPICLEPSVRAWQRAALALPYADTEAMQMRLDEISCRVARGAHAVLLLDRAGWRTTDKLNLPKNMTLIFLPSRSPELNPVENVWRHLRANWLSNRIFEPTTTSSTPPVTLE